MSPRIGEVVGFTLLAIAAILWLLFVVSVIIERRGRHRVVREAEAILREPWLPKHRRRWRA